MRIAVACLAVMTSTAHAEPDPERPPRHVVRLVIETAGLFGLGQAWYYRHGLSTNRGDWELPGDWSAIRTKLGGDGFRYDPDGFVTNAVHHPVFGTAAYLLARENGFGAAGSFAWSSLCSGLWETFGEWREYGSINDLLATSTSGVPLGEAVHQIVHHLDETRFEIYGGVADHAEAGTARALALAGVRADLDRLPAGGRHVELAAELPADRSGARAREVVTRSSLAGIDRHGSGYDVFAGTASTFVYHQVMERPGDPSPDNTWDLLATVGAGPRLELELHEGAVEVRAAVDVQLDFAMVRSWAFEPWRAIHPDAIVRGSLEANAHPYYYATGLSLAPRVAVGYRGLQLGGALGASWFRSLDGHDRYAATMTADPHLDDTDQTAAGWIGYTRRGIAVTLEARARRRASAIGDITAAHAEHATVATLGYAW